MNIVVSEGNNPKKTYHILNFIFLAELNFELNAKLNNFSKYFIVSFASAFSGDLSSFDTGCVVTMSNIFDKAGPSMEKSALPFRPSVRNGPRMVLSPNLKPNKIDYRYLICTR